MNAQISQIVSAFQGSAPVIFQALRDNYNARSIEIMPHSDNPLFLEDDTGVALSLFIPLDSVIGPSTLTQKSWDVIKLAYLEQILNSYDEDLALIDVGANAGFFTRQSLNRFKNIKSVFCYEPHPYNFELAGRNLANLAIVKLNNFGLSDKDGALDFYIDPMNCGNFSLEINAMPEQYEKIKVFIKNGDCESKKWIESHNGQFIYKSDTQGLDEIISTSLSFEFWRRVKVGIFELWRLPEKKYDFDKFYKILELFPNKAFEKNPETKVSSMDVINYLAADDKLFDDLYFWR